MALPVKYLNCSSCLQLSLFALKLFFSHNKVPLVIILLFSLIVSNNLSEANPIDGPNTTDSISSDLKDCQTNNECMDLRNDSRLLCVDSTCRCAPNFKQISEKGNQSDSTVTVHTSQCVPFQCVVDEDCQLADEHRVCHVSSGTCLCRVEFLEDLANGRKCVPQYGIVPEYLKKSRKYLNKNRISYREDIENWHNHQILWLQYAAFVAFFVGQVGLLIHYVVRRRQRMVEKMLVRRQNSDQLPITRHLADPASA